MEYPNYVKNYFQLLGVQSQNISIFKDSDVENQIQK